MEKIDKSSPMPSRAARCCCPRKGSGIRSDLATVRVTLGVPSVIVLVSGLTRVVLSVAKIRLVRGRPDSNRLYGGLAVAKEEEAPIGCRPDLRHHRSGKLLIRLQHSTDAGSLHIA